MSSRHDAGCARQTDGRTIWGEAMKCPFPGIDPYLEHPVLWGSLHARLIVEIANRLQPQLDPRYVSSIKKRVYLDIDNLEIRETRVESSI